MSLTPRRPFRLLDAMSLVAATAVGLGLARGMQDPLWSQTNMTVVDGSVGAVLHAAARWTILGLPMIMSLTLAVLLMALQRPRPGFGSLMRRPGTAACGAAALAMAIGAANMMALLAVVRVKQSMGPYEPDRLAVVLVDCLIHGVPLDCGMPGLAVTVAWATLALTGQWHREPHWLDRAGRRLGLAWIVLMVLSPWIRLSLYGSWS